MSSPEIKPLSSQVMNLAQDIIPISKSSSWKGHVIHVNESIRQKFNQIINLFKTGKWVTVPSIREKLCDQIAKDLREATSISDKKTVQLFTKPKGMTDDQYKTQIFRDETKIAEDYQLRLQLQSRLKAMKSVFDAAYPTAKNLPESAAKLKNSLDFAIRQNTHVIEKEQQQLKTTKAPEKEKQQDTEVKKPVTKTNRPLPQPLGRVKVRQQRLAKAAEKSAAGTKSTLPAPKKLDQDFLKRMEKNVKVTQEKSSAAQISKPKTETEETVKQTETEKAESPKIKTKTATSGKFKRARGAHGRRLPEKHAAKAAKAKGA